MLPSPDERPFSRSYGAILPSSLTWFLSRTLVCSTHPPVSVCGTATMAVDFPWVFSAAWLGRLRPGRSQGPASRLGRSLRACTRTTSAGRALPSASPRDTPLRFRNVRLMSIAYASPPRLRDRLTLGGRTWPRKPWICGGQDSRLPCRYSCLHGLRSTLQARSRSPFGACSALSYQIDPKGRFRDFGCALQSRSFSARGHSASGLLRGLQMVAASKPTSWLSTRPHILTIH